MVQLIIGEKGKGKTKELLDKVNKEIQDITGNVVYLDKNTRHMFELNNKIRLIDCSEYLLDSPDAFVGFVSGSFRGLFCVFKKLECHFFSNPICRALVSINS